MRTSKKGKYSKKSETSVQKGHMEDARAICTPLVSEEKASATEVTSVVDRCGLVGGRIAS
jgi:hypothetical protein